MIRLGKIQWVEMSWYGSFTTKAWKRASIEQGGGRLLDLGSHMIDQLLQLFPDARVDSVFGKVQFNHPEAPQTDSHVSTVISLSNGVVG